MLSTVTTLPYFATIQLVLGMVTLRLISYPFFLHFEPFLHKNGFQMRVLKLKLINVITDQITHESTCKYTLQRTTDINIESNLFNDQVLLTSPNIKQI